MATITSEPRSRPEPDPEAEHEPDERPVRRPGRIRATLQEAGEFTSFAGSAILALRTTPRYTAEVMRQTAILVRGSTLIVAFLQFTIAVSAINFGYYLLRAIGATDYTGLVSGVIVTRGTVPLMFGYIFAAKVGCGIVAELGAMKVNDEISAYEAEGVDPVRYVVATRLAATILFLPIATATSLVAGTIGSYFAAVPLLDGLSSTAFLRYHWGVQAVSDQFLAFACIATTAILVVLVSCFYGLRARGGPASVGTASARSLVVNLVLIHLVVPGYLALVYGTDARLPIGG